MHGFQEWSPASHPYRHAVAQSTPMIWNCPFAPRSRSNRPWSSLACAACLAELAHQSAPLPPQPERARCLGAALHSLPARNLSPSLLATAAPGASPLPSLLARGQRGLPAWWPAANRCGQRAGAAQRPGAQARARQIGPSAVAQRGQRSLRNIIGAASLHICLSTVRWASLLLRPFSSPPASPCAVLSVPRRRWARASLRTRLAIRRRCEVSIVYALVTLFHHVARLNN